MARQRSTHVNPNLRSNPNHPFVTNHRSLEALAELSASPDPFISAAEACWLATPSCTCCHGFGVRFTQVKERPALCHCVYRRIFRDCCKSVERIEQSPRQMATPSLFYRGKNSRISYGRPREEFMADFTILARRALGEFEIKVFLMHITGPCDWRACCAALQIDRGAFFHAVRRIEVLLGKAFSRDRRLWPIQEYFGGPQMSRERSRLRAART